MNKLLPLAGLAALWLPAQSETVTALQARAIAAQFLTHTTRQQAPSATAPLTLVHEARTAGGAADYYVFGRGTDGGFVIVSGDDRALPVLGYSDRGAFVADSLPDNVRWWLEQYRHQMQTLRMHPEAARTPRTVATSVAPLMSTRWKQDAPYNEEIPKTRFSLGSRRPLVGCVALAMAQMMRVHSWPTTGQGSHSYRHATTYQGQAVETTYSADFGATTYLWSAMRDSYSSDATATPVATLCYHCGVAVDMEYGVEASGAQIYDAAVALKTYFGYDKGLDLYLRDFYDTDEWDDMLRADLDRGLPIIYGGSTQETAYAPPSGHCFVVDGYDSEGKFHINWGWGGNYDGYFTTGLLDSGRSNCDFSNWQQAILGARPDRDGTSTSQSRPLTGYMIGFDMSVAQAPVGGEAAFTMQGVTFLGEGDFSTPWWGIEILSEDERTIVDAQYIVNAEGTVVGATYSADDAAALTVPAGIAEGTYHIRAVYSLDQDQTRPYFKRPAGKASYVKMVVADGVAQFEPGDIDTPIPPVLPTGDINGDGTVDVIDANIAISIMLGKAHADDYPGDANVDGQGGIDVSDINLIINIILNK